MRRPTLRLATFNVAGRMRSATVALASVLVQLDADVVALQEVKLGASELPGCVHNLNQAVAAEAARLRRQHDGFDFRAAPNAAQPASAGVMLLWRKHLVTSGRLRVGPEQAGDVHWGGRAVSAALEWGGHRLQVVCVYAPNDVASRLFVCCIPDVPYHFGIGPAPEGGYTSVCIEHNNCLAHS